MASDFLVSDLKYLLTAIYFYLGKYGTENIYDFTSDKEFLPSFSPKNLINNGSNKIKFNDDQLNKNVDQIIFWIVKAIAIIKPY